MPFMVIGSANALAVGEGTQEASGIYRDLVEPTTDKALRFYQLFEHCLEDSHLARCAGIPPNVPHLTDHTSAIADGLLRVTDEQRQAATVPQTHDKTLSEAELDFEISATFSLRELAIVMAKTEQACGRDAASLVAMGEEAQKGHISRLTEGDQQYFARLEQAPVEGFNLDEPACAALEQLNSNLVSDVYGYQARAAQQKMDSREKLGLFVYTLLKTLNQFSTSEGR